MAAWTNSWKLICAILNERHNEKDSPNPFHTRKSTGSFTLFDFDRPVDLHGRHIAHLDLSGVLNVAIPKADRQWLETKSAGFRVVLLEENKLPILIKSLQSNPTVLRGIQMTDETISTLERFVATQILKQPNRTIAVEEPLLSSGLIDSFSLMDLALYVEDTFGVRIEDTELNADTFDTLNQLSALIASRK